MASTDAIVRNGPRIAVLRALQLGDLICALPALEALRAVHPRAHVTLIGLPWAAQLRARFARLIDETIDLPGYPGLPEQEPTPRALPEFLRRMQERRFDLSVQLHGSGGVSNTVVAQLAARESIGTYRAADWRPGPGYVLHDPSRSEVERALAVTRGNGMIEPDPVPRFPVSDADREELGATLPDLDPATTVVLHPGARDPRRRWRAEHFAAVADRCTRRGLRVVLTGLAEDDGVHRRVAELADGPVQGLAGALSLGAFAALLADARLVVTNDTAASHLAGAVGAPAVTVFVASDPQRWAPPRRSRLRSVGGPAPRLSTGACCIGDDCSIHRRIRPAHPPLEEVLRAVDALLKEEWRDAA